MKKKNNSNYINYNGCIKMLTYRVTFLLLLFITIFKENKTDDDVKNEIYLYPGKAKSEHDLPLCKERQVCSILHKRFWYPRHVERFCRCDNANECPATWTDNYDKYTMVLNNRAQMKFCEPVTDLPNCMGNDTSIINETRHLHVENRTISLSTNTDEQNFEITSKAKCYCSPHHKWVPNSYQKMDNSLQVSSYRCAELSKCKIDDFCGFEREDNFSIFYFCSCPEGSLCIRRNTLQHPIKELFYMGVAYKALCTRFPLMNN
ncbi:hypothetical protein PGB90_005636 [Kerria lacca]